MAATTEATPLAATPRKADEKADDVSNNNKMAPKTQPPQHAWATVVVASSVMGALFGLAFYKSHVYEPQVIRGQFLFKRFVMLKVRCNYLQCAHDVVSSFASLTPSFRAGLLRGDGNRRAHLLDDELHEGESDG